MKFDLADFFEFARLKVGPYRYVDSEECPIAKYFRARTERTISVGPNRVRFTRPLPTDPPGTTQYGDPGIYILPELWDDLVHPLDPREVGNEHTWEALTERISKALKRRRAS